MGSKWIKRKIEEELETLIKKGLADNRKILIKHIGHQNKEFIFKNESKITIVSPAKEDEVFLFDLLKKWEFDKITPINIPDKGTQIDADIVILNNKTGTIPANEFKTMISDLPKKTVICYFGPGRLEVPNGYEDVTTFANVPPQLYGNLINALHYHDALV